MDTQRDAKFCTWCSEQKSLSPMSWQTFPQPRTCNNTMTITYSSGSTNSNSISCSSWCSSNSSCCYKVYVHVLIRTKHHIKNRIKSVNKIWKKPIKTRLQLEITYISVGWISPQHSTETPCYLRTLCYSFYRLRRMKGWVDPESTLTGFEPGTFQSEVQRSTAVG